MPVCPANIRETRMAIGIVSQVDPVTSNMAGDVSFTKLNDTLAEFTPVTENDANWIGKGNEFPTEEFLTSWSVSVSIEKYLSSEYLAHTAIFALGHVTGAGAPYTIKPADPIVDCIEMKLFGYLEAIRQASSPVLDRLFVGVAVEEFQVALTSGPGLNNSKITATYVGTGKQVQPSGVSVPAISTEHILSAGTLAMTVQGVDYVTSRNMVSAQFGFKNNVRLDSGYFPGSGYQNASDPASGQIRGRMEFGDRVATMSFVARFLNGSSELTKLLSQVTGTAVLALSGATGNNMTVTYWKCAFKSAVVGSTDGIVTVAVEILPIFDATNGLLTMLVTTPLAGIG